MTYAIVSDLHCHKWSAYSAVDADGVNSRLRIILDELMRAGKEVLAAGGQTVVIDGDIFHVRGSLDPEVLNPTQNTIRLLMDMGVRIEAIPGNHDLVGNETTELGSAIQTLSETFSTLGTIEVFNEPRLVFGPQPRAFVPWVKSVPALLKEIEKLAKLAGGEIGDYDLHIHAGIDGTIATMPDHGLDAATLAGFGFRHVFAGHYHNHKDHGDGVFSIGATTHQTWSDVGSKAGFLIVHDDGRVEFFNSHAPEFVDVSGMSENDMTLLADGNYVRYRGQQMTPAQARELREFLVDSGAKGVSIQAPRPATNLRQSARPTSGALTLAQSIDQFVDQAKTIPAHLDRNEVKKRCADVLAKAQEVVEEA